VRARLFWKLGLTYIALLLGVLLTVDLYSARVLRREYLFKTFLNTMEIWGEKLGPLLFQFVYFNRQAFKSLDEFLARLVPFLKKLPKGYRFAVEIRNKNWLVQKFANTLRERGVALTLIDQAWMPRPTEWFAKLDPITADFTYVRWLGDRKGIEEKTKTWDKVIVNRSQELTEWVEILRNAHKRKIQIFACANNHYAMRPQPSNSLKSCGKKWVSVLFARREIPVLSIVLSKNRRSIARITTKVARKANKYSVFLRTRT
jgi:uncharacterized protein YecE (DUF72 family)